MEQKDFFWTEISEKYKGLWIALDEKETNVIASSDSAKTVYTEARKKGVDVPVLFKVPDEIVAYVGVL